MVKEIKKNLLKYYGLIMSLNSDILYADEFEDAFLGYAQILNNTIALYSKRLCIDILISQGMPLEEAEKYFEYNVLGRYMGEKTPGYFISKDEV